jgi:hypothetical protein
MLFYEEARPNYCIYTFRFNLFISRGIGVMISFVHVPRIWFKCPGLSLSASPRGTPGGGSKTICMGWFE